MIHVVNKGKEGEREICRMLNQCLNELIETNTFDEETVELLKNVVQRNQNQSAVGGGDINLFGLSVEVKRQEQLQVETWWRQATASAARNKDRPVLIYRQNRKAWHVVIDGWLSTARGVLVAVRTEISVDDFKVWFKQWVSDVIAKGELSRV